MKTPILKTKLARVLRSIGIGAVKGLSGPLGGAVDEVITNIQSPEGGEGKIDWVRLVSYLAGAGVFIFLCVLLIKGLIDIEQLKQLWKIFN